MTKPSILQLGLSFSIGGTEKTMQLLAAGLVKHGWNITLGALHEGGDREQELRTRFGDDHVRVFGGDVDALISDIQEHDYRIVHVHRSTHEWLPIIQRIKTETQAKVVETYVFSKPSRSPLEAHADVRIFVSRTAALKYQRMWNPAYTKPQWAIVYNPLDPAAFPAIDKATVQAWKRGHDIPETAFVMGRFGRGTDEKFGRMVLEMLPAVLREVPNAVLVLQSAPESVRRYVHRKGLAHAVRILPETTDVFGPNQFYHAIDVLTHASLIGESFGNTLAEAQFAGKPVVVESTPFVDNAQVEVVDHGVTGFVVDNPVSYAHAVIQLANNPELRQSFGKAGQAKAMQYYTAAHAIDAVERIYARLLDGKPLDALEEYSDEYERRVHAIYEPRVWSSMWSECKYRFRKKWVFGLKKLRG